MVLPGHYRFNWVTGLFAQKTGSYSIVCLVFNSFIWFFNKFKNGDLASYSAFSDNWTICLIFSLSARSLFITFHINPQFHLPQKIIARTAQKFSINGFINSLLFTFYLFFETNLRI